MPNVWLRGGLYPVPSELRERLEPLVRFFGEANDSADKVMA